jgi:FkbM family methyltransferase
MSSPDFTLFHRLRLGANKILAPLGIEIVKAPRSGNDAELISLPIGRFRLLIQRNNSLWREYAKNPEYTAQLGRLAKCVFTTYPSGCMIDVGANIGDTAAMVRNVCEAVIVCVEGDAAIFAQLQKNIAPMGKVMAHQCFVGQRTEKVQVQTSKDGWDATLIPVEQGAADGVREVAILSLDDFVERLNLDQPCKLLKLDIEGFDLRALRGAPRLLARDKPAILFEFNHENLTALREDGMQIFRYLAALGYEHLCLHDAQGFFMLSCQAADAALLSDLGDYAQSVDGLFYYDICAFHSSDTELASRFAAQERSHRKSVLGRKRGHGEASLL